MYDLIIIGAGPIGLACGIEAQKNNLSYLIIEKGCLVNSIYNYPKNMLFFSTSDNLEIGEVPFISHGVKPTRSEALEYYRRVKEKWELNVNVYEKVLTISRDEETFKVVTEKNLYETKHVIISTGFYDYPNYLKIPGENLAKVKHYYDEPHPYADQKILVVGAGNSAVDVALETYRRGAKVTMVVRGDKFEKNVKYWVLPDIENRIKENKIRVFLNSRLILIKEKYVVIETPKGKKEIENDFILAMTGYHPDFEFLENAGINIKDESTRIPVYHPDTFETNIRNLYLAGVVCSGTDTSQLFIENTRYHAVNIIHDILSKR